jgi:murein DD-endopeptidase MepM/ murein hydrolase activator NlpD
VTRRAYPYGDGSCCDTGFEISGTGQFAGHVVMIFYCDPNQITVPSPVTKGQIIATHRGLHCGCYDTGMTDHIHYQVDYNGVRIDPASFLFC